MNNFCRWQVGAAKARFTPSDFPRLCRGTCEGEQHKGTKKTHTTRSMSVCGQNKYHMIWCQQCVFLLFEIKSFFFFFSSPLKLVGVRLMNLQCSLRFPQLIPLLALYSGKANHGLLLLTVFLRMNDNSALQTPYFVCGRLVKLQAEFIHLRWRRLLQQHQHGCFFRIFLLTTF